ncbi:MAG: hypothetical protein ACYCV4_17165 [Dermatophilaceae bacterium]
MTIGAEIGGGVELGSTSLGVIAAVGAKFDGLAAQVRKLLAEQDAYEFGAVEVALRGAATSTASGSTLVIDLGGPTHGRLWQVRRLVVGGAQWGSVVAGTALVVVGGSASITPPTSDVADYSAAIPNVAFYSTGQLVVRNPSRLYMVVLTPTASATYAVGGAATDMPDRRERIVTPD